MPSSTPSRTGPPESPDHGALKGAKAEEWVRFVRQRHDVGLSASQSWRREARRGFNYYENAQRPPAVEGYEDVLYITLNLVKARLDTKVGILTQAKPRPEVIGRGAEDMEVAAAFKDLLQYSLDEDRLDTRILDAVGDMMKCGLGVLEEVFNPDHKQLTRHGWAPGKIELSVGDPLKYVVDPGNRSSTFWGDGGPDWYFTEHRATIDELIMRYPEHKLQLETMRTDIRSGEDSAESIQSTDDDYASSGFDGTDDSGSDEGASESYDSQDMVPQLIHWYKKDVPVDRIFKLDPENGSWQLAQTAEGDAITDAGMIPEDDEDNYEVIRSIEQEVWTCSVVGELLLYNRHSPYTHGKWPVIFFSGTMHRGQAMPYGEVHNLFDAQDLYNKLMSVTLDNAIRSNNTGWQLEEGAMDPKEEERLTNEGGQPGFIARLRMGRIDGLRRLEPGSLPRGLWEIQKDIRTTFDELSSLYQTQRGGMPYETSGKAVIALQQAADSALVHLQRHIEWAINDLGRKRLSNIQQFYTYERAWRISDKVKEMDFHIITELGFNEQEGDTSLHLLKAEPGNPEPILLLKDFTKPEFDVKFVMGTGHERSRDERLKEAQFLFSAGAVDPEYLMKEFEVEGRREITDRMQEKNDILQLGVQVQTMLEDEMAGPLMMLALNKPNILMEALIQAGIDPGMLAQAAGSGGPGPSGPPGPPGPPQPQNGRAPEGAMAPAGA
tara:strand:- start:8183 stop:10342 length:2160 start_codon:yes stop_codon:yes gene_type:complete